jgi:raffinose/stachyose/melibiose transport system substrate-binding protein
MKAYRWYSLVLIVVLLLSLSACTVPAAAPAGGETGAPSAEGEVVEILFWDQFPEVSDKMDEIVADFNAAHPNIKVTRESYQTEALRDVIRPALTSGTGPDIFYYDLGPGFAGVLARAGLLMPLDDAYADKGWDQRIYEWTRDRAVFDGKSYGVANELEFIGIFYNKGMFEANGWELPQSWDELLGLCDKANEAGVIPMGFTNGESWPSYHMFSMMMNNQVGKDRLAAMISGEESWDTEDTVIAIKRFFVDAKERGCFIEDVNAVNYSDGLALLATGQAAMHPTGTWRVEAYSDPTQTTEDIGFFFLPALDGNPVVVPGGIGSGWVVSANSQHPEETLTFLDYLISEEMGPRWVAEIGAVPAYPVDTSALDLPELKEFALDIIASQADSMGYNIDVLTPDNFNKVMWDGFAAVLAGIRTPEEQAAALEAAMQEAIAAGNVIDITE